MRASMRTMSILLLGLFGFGMQGCNVFSAAGVMAHNLEREKKIEVLADRYQKVVTSTERHEKANEIAMDIVLDRQFEVKKNGCEEGFPFFIVPSLFDKKMDGNFQLLVYSEKPIVIQMLDDAARKL